MGENSGTGGAASKIYGRPLIFIKAGERAARRRGGGDFKSLVASGLRLEPGPGGRGAGGEGREIFLTAMARGSR